MGGGPESRCVGHVYSLDGAFATGFVMWRVVRVSDQLEQRVQIASALFGNQFLSWWRDCI